MMPRYPIIHLELIATYCWFFVSYENCKTEQSVFYRERELLIIESLCILRTLLVPP